MCRFLLAKSKKGIDTKILLNQFADMCRASKTQDEDWQGDGWGIAWINSKGKWQLIKSLSPIWEEKEKITHIPNTTMLVAHARSSSFNEHKGNIDFNEPFIEGEYCFVFNGMLIGVKLKAKGQIGAQKVWSILQNELSKKKPLLALKNLSTTLIKNSRVIKGLNIGLATKDSFFILCGKQGEGDYFTLRKMNSDNIQILCSEEIGDYQFEKMKENETISL